MRRGRAEIHRLDRDQARAILHCQLSVPKQEGLLRVPHDDSHYLGVGIVEVCGDADPCEMRWKPVLPYLVPPLDLPL